MFCGSMRPTRVKHRPSPHGRGLSAPPLSTHRRNDVVDLSSRDRRRRRNGPPRTPRSARLPAAHRSTRATRSPWPFAHPRIAPAQRTGKRLADPLLAPTPEFFSSSTPSFLTPAREYPPASLQSRRPPGLEGRGRDSDARGMKASSLAEQIDQLVRDHLAQVRAEATAAVERAFERSSAAKKMAAAPKR